VRNRTRLASGGRGEAARVERCHDAAEVERGRAAGVPGAAGASIE
jgi:hypothetical protein